MYAIVVTGGKQYKVTPGQAIDVDHLAINPGDAVELDKVLLIADEGKITVGTPTVDGARVLATADRQGKAKKIIVFRYKPKVRYRKKTGHRELYTRLIIDRIAGPGEAAAEPVKKTRRRKKEVTESGT